MADSDEEQMQRPVSPEEEEPVEEEEEEIDEETLRILVSTDNHLGFAERDPVRGGDSFAAFEEVLALAKRHKCDIVLLAGDLFHDNKPTRRTLHKTMEIIRRYCMGPDPVQVQVVSDQASNFRNVNGVVNYEDENYSIDLPIFSIHGNHDDPTRDGGTEMLAALDLLAVSNLVNYFGRQDEVDKVEVAPVLLKKGNTQVAIFGMGSMRDERLNRMWQGKKVRFMRPDNMSGENGGNDADEEDEEERQWFNIFALHQNRDLGRGSKNCVHESMIPEWMDLVVWGHEHECNIVPHESSVGTFRITQPGSSVATSLTAGEAERKNVGILDIRGCDFRLRAIPLSQVRSFVAGEISLQDQDKDVLDPEDPNIDEAMGDLLAARVSEMVEEAREQAAVLREDAKEAAKSARSLGNVFDGSDEAAVGDGLKEKLQKEDQVLIRLKVEHSGFSTLNNQRFGSRFVGDVANPSDILLFHRRRQTETTKKSDGKKAAKGKKSSLENPMDPEDLAEINVEDLIAENLETAERLEVLDEQSMGAALEDFVSKEQTKAINETVAEVLNKQQKVLMKRRGNSSNGDDEEGVTIKTAAALKEVIKNQAEKSRAEAAADAEERAEKKAARRKRGVVSPENKNRDDSDVSDSDAEEKTTKGSRAKARGGTKKKATATSRSTSSKGKAKKKSRDDDDDDDFSDDDDDIEVVNSAPATKKKASRSAPRPARRTAASKARYNYDDGSDESSDAVVDDDDDSDIEVVEVKPRSQKKGRAKAGTSKKQSKLSAGTSSSIRGGSASFTSARKGKENASSSSRRKRTASSYYDSDDDDAPSSSIGAGADWGTAASQSQSKRSRR